MSAFVLGIEGPSNKTSLVLGTKGPSNEMSLVLGIETSCDETSAAVVANGRRVLSNVISSQINTHRPYGGVVPEIAARKHLECISYVVEEALSSAGVALQDLHGVAVANGPGLPGALLTGLPYAKALALAQGLPLVGVHHIHGHICANYLADPAPQPPFVCLVVSGGHTHLVQVEDHLTCRVLGRTRDDAAGEAFDKTGRALGLPYPGGPHIDALAKEGDPHIIPFPRAKLPDTLDFSFSGLKSAVLLHMQKHGTGNTADIAASFQQAVVDVLVANTLAACRQTGLSQVVLAGGVAANGGLRTAFAHTCKAEGFQLFMPPPVLCTDNAAMVAAAGFFALQAGHTSGWDLNAFPSMDL